MKRTLCAVLSIALVFSLTPSQGQPKRKGTVCWPLHFAGITVGLTTDSQAQRLLGHGVFRSDEGHTGGRYFIDSKRTATLHIVEGVDTLIEELTLSSGISRKIAVTERSAAVSKWLDPREGFGNWHALNLGSSKDEVLANLGEPQKRETRNKWIYESTCSCELPEYLTLTFSQDRVSEINLFAGE